MSHYILDVRTATAHFPGIGRYVTNLALSLNASLAPGEQLTLLGDLAKTATCDESPSAADVHTIPVSVSPFGAGQQWRIPNLLRRLPLSGPALYHCPYYFFPYRTGMPTVLTFYDVIPLLYPQTVSLQARVFFRIVATVALRAASHILTVSEAARADLIRYFSVPPEKISMTPLAADSRFQPQPSAEIDRVRARYDLPTRFVLYFGANKPHKNLPALIDAFSQLSARHTPPLIIGGFWDRRYPQPRRRAAQLRMCESVRFLGPVDDADLPALYSAATVFVFPSLYEGFGLPVLEAMSCGTPVACANTSSLPEIVGQAARQFDPRSVAEIKEAVGALLEDDPLRADLGARGLERANHFSWQRTAASTLRCYRDLLGG